MSTICAEQQHKFHPSHPLLSPKNPHTLREIDIPPRKLLTHRRAAAADMFSDDTILQKFLPSNDSDSDSDDPYSSDHFRMYEFKVRRCTRTRSHDWTDCPFAHPGEKARRRDPRRYHYSGTVCPEYRRGGCILGDGCEFAHGVFECWLHPARYRTEACKDGKNCKRKVCFFAHTPRQLRILPVSSSPSNEFSCNNTTIAAATNNINNKLFLNRPSARPNNCCLFCLCGNNANGNSSTASPTSTLFGMSHFSPPASPPLSPLKPRNGAVSVSVSPVSRYGGAASHHHQHNHNHNRYKDVLTELMGSFEGLNFNEGCCSPVSGAKAAPNNLAWLDVPALHNCEEQFLVSSPSASKNNSSSSFGCEDQQQFILSPSTIQNPTPVSFKDNVNKLFFSHDNEVVGADVNNGSSCPAPDLGWVNELLM